jgi:co-chaperonin GroES (HSP10)
MNKKINPNYGQAVLRPLEEGEQNFGGIVIPDMGQETSRMGTIVEISPIYNFNLGTFVESKFKVGDLVMFPPMGGVKVKVDGEDFIIASVSDLLASVTE